MNIKQAKEEIKNTVHAYLDKNEYDEYVIPEIRQRPVLLMGPPGVGKTMIMQQIASECGIGLVSYTITHHTRQSAVGLPFLKEKTYQGESHTVTEYTMSEIIASIYEYMESTGLAEGILFIDEINCVSETLAPTMLQFLQCKTFGNQKIPAGWIIAAAGNPPEYNKSVRDFDFVTLDRVRRMDIEADLPVFKEYARSRHLHPFILSYLELRPGNFYRTENDVDGLSFVTARGWEDLSYLISSYENLGIRVDEYVIGQYLQHEDVAKDVASYYDLYKKYRDDYDISSILKGRVKTGIYQRLMSASFDERLSCVELLVSGLHNTAALAMDTDRLTDECYAFLKAYRKILRSNNDVNSGSTAHSDKGLGATTHVGKDSGATTHVGKDPGATTHVGKDPGSTSHSDNVTGTTAVPAGDLISSSVPVRIWQDMLKQKEAEFSLQEKTGLVSPLEKNFFKKLIKCLTDWTPLPEAGDPFSYVRSGFDGLRSIRTERIDECASSLGHAFTFMEDAFGEGQEMVIFVTELTMDPDISRFINENGCDPYFRYSKSLLIGNRRAEILAELARDEHYSDPGAYAF